MAPDTVQVRLHLRLIRVLGVVTDALDKLVVSVCATRSWSRCPHAGSAVTAGTTSAPGTSATWRSRAGR